LWLNRGDGTFRRGLRYGVGQTAWDIAFGDFDGDGIGDVAVASQVAQGSWWYPGVTLFHGLSVTTTIPGATPPGTQLRIQAAPIRRGDGGAEPAESNTSNAVVR
jgi:hypothetical protein